MSRLRHLCAPTLRLVARTLGLFGERKAGFRILLFHDVPAGQTDAFRILIDYVAATHGLITPAEAAARLAGHAGTDVPAPGGRMPCLISFDDGFRSNFDIAGSVLDAAGAKALFFVCPELIELAGEAQRVGIAERIFQGRMRVGDLAAGTRLMDWDELRTLQARGHEIGCHGMGHRRLSELRGADLVREVYGAGDLLADRLGQATPWYAYAFGDIGSVDEAALRVVGERFHYCRSGIRGANGAATPRLALAADSLAPGDPIAYQKLLLEGGLDLLYHNRRQRLRTLATAADNAP